MASITHFGDYAITEMKEHLRDRGLPPESAGAARHYCGSFLSNWKRWTWS